MKKLHFILLISAGLLLSGCLDNPIKKVPVISVNITLSENSGFVDIVDSNFSQGTVIYLNRPKREQASFPAIASRTMISKGNNSIIGQWEMIPYDGPGTYLLNIGFIETKYPVSNDIVHISIYIVDTKGERIGFMTKDIVWN